MTDLATAQGVGPFDHGSRDYTALGWLPSGNFALLTGSSQTDQHELMVFSIDCVGERCGPVTPQLYASRTGTPVGRLLSARHGAGFAILTDEHGTVPFGYGFDRMEPAQQRGLGDLFE